MTKFHKRLLCACLTLLTVAASVLSSCSKKEYDHSPEEYIILPEKTTDFNVTDEMLSERVEELIEEQRRASMMTSAVTDRPAKEGDMVSVSLKCYTESTYGSDNPTELKNVSDPDCNLMIGGGKYPPELENSVLGLLPGEKKVVKVTYAADHSLPSLAGASVYFEVTVNAITSVTLPEYNAAFVINFTDCSSKGEYEEKLKNAAKREFALDYYKNNCEIISYPKEELGSYSDNFIQYYSDLAAEAGETPEEYVIKKYFITLAAFHEKANEYAKELVTEDLIIYALSERLDVKITDEEYEEGAKYYAEKYGYRSVAAIEGKFGKEFISFSLLKEKTLDAAYEDLISAQTPEE